MPNNADKRQDSSIEKISPFVVEMLQVLENQMNKFKPIVVYWHELGPHIERVACSIMRTIAVEVSRKCGMACHGRNTPKVQDFPNNFQPGKSIPERDSKKNKHTFSSSTKGSIALSELWMWTSFSVLPKDKGTDVYCAQMQL